MSNEELSNVSSIYNPFTLRDVQEKYAYIQWTEYINELLPFPLSVDENEVIVVGTPSYLEELGNILNNTPPHVISNYVKWHAIWTHFKLTPTEKNQKGKKCTEAIGSR